MSGWFAVARGITEHPLFQGRPDRLAAWIWMLDNTAWKDTRQNVNGTIVKVKRGQLCASQAMMQRGTGMTRKALRVFLRDLENEGAVVISGATNGAKARAMITLCNWGKYQDAGPSEGQARAKRGPTKETREQGNKTPSVSDIAQAGFDDFWQAVPRKVGKGQARKAYAAALKKTDHAALMAGITAYAASREGEDPQFTKHPASWLNGECWEDEPQPTGGTHDARGSAARGRGRNDGHAALMAGFAAAAHSNAGGLPSHSADVSGAFDASEPGVDCGPRGNASEPFLRLVNGWE